MHSLFFLLLFEWNKIKYASLSFCIRFSFIHMPNDIQSKKKKCAIEWVFFNMLEIIICRSKSISNMLLANSSVFWNAKYYKLSKGQLQNLCLSSFPENAFSWNVACYYVYFKMEVGISHLDYLVSINKNILNLSLKLLLKTLINIRW